MKRMNFALVAVVVGLFGCDTLPIPVDVHACPGNPDLSYCRGLDGERITGDVGTPGNKLLTCVDICPAPALPPCPPIHASACPGADFESGVVEQSCFDDAGENWAGCLDPQEGYVGVCVAGCGS